MTLIIVFSFIEVRGQDKLYFHALVFFGIKLRAAAELFGARIKTDGGCGIVGEIHGRDVVVVEVDDTALEGEFGDLAVAFGLPERAVGEAERRRA